MFVFCQNGIFRSVNVTLVIPDRNHIRREKTLSATSVNSTTSRRGGDCQSTNRKFQLFLKINLAD